MSPFRICTLLSQCFMLFDIYWMALVSWTQLPVFRRFVPRAGTFAQSAEALGKKWKYCFQHKSHTYSFQKEVQVNWINDSDSNSSKGGHEQHSAGNGTVKALTLVPVSPVSPISPSHRMDQCSPLSLLDIYFWDTFQKVPHKSPMGWGVRHPQGWLLR